ncbi:MAG TPA: hypothetical protein VK849_12275, partial [Longimicrobiales bacterium]|nr:hypothetical protein [Longimicrobiales bacterium]
LSSYYGEGPPRGEVTVVVAGRAEDEPGEEGREREARALATRMLAEGVRASAVAREIADRLALPRNVAYRIVHETAQE